MSPGMQMQAVGLDDVALSHLTSRGAGQDTVFSPFASPVLSPRPGSVTPQPGGAAGGVQTDGNNGQTKTQSRWDKKTAPPKQIQFQSLATAGAAGGAAPPGGAGGAPPPGTRPPGVRQQPTNGRTPTGNNLPKSGIRGMPRSMFVDFYE